MMSAHPPLLLRWVAWSSCPSTLLKLSSISLVKVMETWRFSSKLLRIFWKRGQDSPALGLPGYSFKASVKLEWHSIFFLFQTREWPHPLAEIEAQPQASQAERCWNSILIMQWTALIFVNLCLRLNSKNCLQYERRWLARCTLYIFGSIFFGCAYRLISLTLLSCILKSHIARVYVAERINPKSHYITWGYLYKWT